MLGCGAVGNRCRCLIETLAAYRLISANFCAAWQVRFLPDSLD
jgi:hypothetical protein